MDLGNGERGIWNFKSTEKESYIEMEFDLKRDESCYLLYRVDVKPGLYNPNGVFIGEGDIFLVKNHIPFDWNKKHVRFLVVCAHAGTRVHAHGFNAAYAFTHAHLLLGRLDDLRCRWNCLRL